MADKIKMMNMTLSVQAIYFLKTRKTICTGGYIVQKDKWIGAIIHAETGKLVINTKPVFDKKMDAINFMEELRYKAKQISL